MREEIKDSPTLLITDLFELLDFLKFVLFVCFGREGVEVVPHLEVLSDLNLGMTPGRAQESICSARNLPSWP